MLRMDFSGYILNYVRSFVHLPQLSSLVMFCGYKKRNFLLTSYIELKPVQANSVYETPCRMLF